tara:strand:+ start:5480 stop:6268 length:789 start_codon:yes stop_codon:yes gene_type:complete
MDRLIFVTYASGRFKANVKLNIFFAKLSLRPIKSIVLSDLDLKKDSIYSSNQEIFNASIGGGYWAWKPWAILQAMLQGEDGDIVIYHDCGRGLKYKNFRYPINIINHVKHFGAMPGILIPNHGSNKDWTHPKCFSLMKCESDLYYNSPQVEASISAWQVNNTNIIFIKEWLSYCLNLEIIGNQYNADQNLIPHRYDQSVLTNLVLRNNLKPLEVKFKETHLTKSISLVDLRLSKKLYNKIFINLILFLIKMKRCLRKITRPN